MVFTHNFKHRGPYDARQISHPAKPQSKGRHQKMDGLILPVTLVARTQHRKPAKLYREQQDGIDCDDEGRNRDGRNRYDAGQTVHEGIPTHRRIAAKRNADQHCPAETRCDERQRIGQVFHDDLAHRPLAPEIGAKIALQEPPKKGAELHDDRIVQAKLLGDPRLHFCIGAGTQHDRCRIARNELQRSEKHHHRGDENQYGQSDALDGVE